MWYNNAMRSAMDIIYKNTKDAAAEYGMDGNLIAGANIAGFLKVAEAMMAQGII